MRIGTLALPESFDSPVIYGVRVETSNPYHLLISKPIFTSRPHNNTYPLICQASFWEFYTKILMYFCAGCINAIITGLWQPNGSNQHISRLVSLMDAILQRDSTLMPFSLSSLPPPWKTFSIAMPHPTTSAPACSQIEMRPLRASPCARKSSTIRTLSPLQRYSFEQTTVFVFPWVKDLTSALYTSSEILEVLLFLANTALQLNT